jgi:ferredoxin
MRVIIEEDKCCGAGQCVMAAPTVFDQREEDGIVILLDETPPDDKLDEVKQAIRLCPALAIKVEV